MNRIKSIFKSKLKMYSFIIVLLLILFFSVGIPTIARYKNRNMITSSVWDGTIATNYRSGTGTIDDPYIIADGSELALLASNLNTTDYANTYFNLSNDIILNNGIFSYNDNLINYTLNSTDYYIEPFTNKYYSDNNYTTSVGSVNIFNSLNNFKGNLNGNSYRIYGLYITSNSNEQLGLFTNLEGNISNLYVENSLIYGGVITSGIASIANNTTITNTLYDGYVISDNNTVSKSIDIATITKTITENSEETININSNQFLDRIISSSTITGINNSTGIVKINNTILPTGEFSINLGTNLLNEINIQYEAVNSKLIDLSNIEYTINYQESMASGIVAEANNVSLTNVVNKGTIISGNNSSGLIGRILGPLTINYSYNRGNIISSNYTSGLISNIVTNDNITISNSYNDGLLTSLHKSSFITNIYDNSNIVIENSFDASISDNLINSKGTSTISLSNCYYVSNNIVSGEQINTGLTSTTISNLKNKDYLQNNLLFNEFINITNYELNNSNVWIFEPNNLPRLFIDDINIPAIINIQTYFWNNSTSTLKNVYLSSNIIFSINSNDDLNPLTSIEYLVASDPITNENLINNTEWELYTDVVTISNEGNHIIYAKVIDSYNNTYYLNSDRLILDSTEPNISINLDDNSWNNFRNTSNYIYIDEPKEITITAADELSGIKKTEYYISNEVLNLEDLENVNWIKYENNINISTTGINIVYIKSTDNCNNIKYANSDLIVMNGYSYNNIQIGNETFSNNVNITNKSSIAINYTFNATISNSNLTHNIVSNILLPVNSKIVIKDNISNKYYRYTIDSSEDTYGYNDSCNDDTCTKIATYPFALFKEIGNVSNTNNFNEEEYTSLSENFTIILDLSNTNITNNYLSVLLCIEIKNNSGETIIPTLSSSKKYFNIYKEANPTTYLDYSGQIPNVNYNSDSITEINITSGINYHTINNNYIYDSRYMTKNNYLRIQLFNSNNQIVEKQYLKNIVLEYNDANYYAYNDGSYYINMGSSINNIDSSIKIKTSRDTSKLKNGNYYFKIINYLSNDGIYDANYLGENIIIPVTVANGINNHSYSFDVKLDSDDRIINKNTTTNNLVFNVLYNGELVSPNIVVSLHKKNLLTAYDQTYSIVDLSEYTTSNLTTYNGNYYYKFTDFVISNENEYNDLQINLNCSILEYTGYEFIFDLYDGNQKIDTIGKKVIVK